MRAAMTEGRWLELCAWGNSRALDQGETLELLAELERVKKQRDANERIVRSLDYRVGACSECGHMEVRE